MRVGITGRNGFIGSAVAQKLSIEGHQVFSLDNYTRCCALDKLTLNSCPANLDWVLHFGASTSIQSSFEDPFTTFSNNLESTLIALKIAYRSKASFVFMSSYVYGPPKYLPVDEKHSLNPVNPYMGSKVVGEEICRQLSDMLKIPLIILRGFNIYGDCQKPGRLIPDMMKAFREDTPLILNDPTPKRDYLYIRDFELLMLKIIIQNPVKTGTYNVGCGHSYSNLEVAKMFRKLSEHKQPIVIKSCKRPEDIMDCTVDVNLIKETFSWSPLYSLEMGLKELIHQSFQQ